MANRIKGITVEIGGDTTGLDKALKSVNTNLKNTQAQLKDVNRLLKLDPTNIKNLSVTDTFSDRFFLYETSNILYNVTIRW